MIEEREIRRRRLRLPERGIELALVDWGGNGPLALLSHANGFCADVLGLLAERLRPRFRVIGFDSRGHGDSEKPAPPGPYAWEEFARDVIAVAEHVTRDLERPRVALGLTLGGIPAVLVAAFLVKELPLYALRWMVLGVVAYTGTLLLAAARLPQET